MSLSRGPVRRLAARLGLCDALDRPVFLVGCGRSGTTILGRTLGQHPAVTYLNEPRHIWTRYYPETDIWSPDAARRGGRVHLDERCARHGATRRLRLCFDRQTRKTGRPRLIEKLPINSFRLRFLDAAFPDALFLHLVRHGVEVARSIAGLAGTEGWFGTDDYIWRSLVEHARADPRSRTLPDLCGSPFERGLLEWRMSVEAALDFQADTAPGRWLEVRYEQLLADPPAVLERIERFLGLASAVAVRTFGAAEIGRRSPEATGSPLSAAALAIGGPLLARLGYDDPQGTPASPRSP